MLIGNSSIRVVAALRSPHFCNDPMCYNKPNVTYFRSEPPPISLCGPLIKMPLVFIGCMGPSVSLYRPLIKIFLICIILDLHGICLRGRLPKWNFKKAKWDIFQDQCIKEITFTVWRGSRINWNIFWLNVISWRSFVDDIMMWLISISSLKLFNSRESLTLSKI